MECPYCGDMMLRGFMQSGRPISWLPKRLKLFSHSGFTEKGAVVFSEGNGLAAPCAIAYHCPKCKKVIIDYKNGCDYYKQKTERGEKTIEL